MTGPWQERWLRWSSTGACRLFVQEADIARLDSMLGAAYGPVGLLDSTAELKEENGTWILGVYHQGTFRRSKLAGPDEIAGALAAELGLSCVRGSWLWRRGACVCLLGPDRDLVRLALERDGWRHAGEAALWQPDAPEARIDNRAFAVAHLIRCRRAPSARAATVTPVDVEEAAGWLSGPRFDWLVPARLVFGEETDAASAIDDLVVEAPEQAPEVFREPESRRLATGDAGVQVVSIDLRPEDVELVRYCSGALEGAAGRAAASIVVLARVGTEVFWAWSTGPTHLERRSDSDVARLAGRIDHVVQRAMVDDDRTHVVFLGSAVQRDDTVIWLIGMRGCGKTSLALELALAHGFSILADDFVPWHPREGEITPFAKCCRLGVGGFAELDAHRQRGLRFPPTDTSSAIWMINPGVELRQPAPMPGRAGVVVRCLLDPTIHEPYLLSARPEERVRFDLHQDTRPPPCNEGALDRAVDAVVSRFAGWTLRYRDRVAAAAALATLAGR